MFLLICFVVLISYGYWFSTKNLSYWKNRGLNGPKPLPIFENLLDILLIDRTDLELNYYRKYDNIYGYYLSNTPVLVVGEPELIKNILVKDFHIFPQRRANDNPHLIMKKHLAGIHGKDWKRIRSITTPTFTSSKMKKMYPLMEECLNDFMVHLDDLAETKSSVNIKDIYGKLTLDVIASSAFATKLNSRKELDSLFVQHARRIFRINPIKLFLTRIIPKSVFEMIGVRDDRTSQYESQEFYVNIVREMIKNRKDSGQRLNDFLQLLMDADQSVTNDEIDSSESHHVNEGKEELHVEKKVLNVQFNSSNKKIGRRRDHCTSGYFFDGWL